MALSALRQSPLELGSLNGPKQNPLAQHFSGQGIICLEILCITPSRQGDNLAIPHIFRRSIRLTATRHLQMVQRQRIGACTLNRTFSVESWQQRFEAERSLALRSHRMYGYSLLFMSLISPTLFAVS
jgi:hypothetical protein